MKAAAISLLFELDYNDIVGLEENYYIVIPGENLSYWGTI